MKCVYFLLSSLLCLSLNATSAIKNRYLSLQQTSDSLILSSETKPQKISIELPGEMESAQVSTCHDPLRGLGKRLTIKHGTRTTLISLYDNDAFAQIETLLHNESEEEIEINKITIADLTIDLGVEPEELVKLTTDGRDRVEQARGSFAYTVLADPESRNGVVCGWLTQLRGLGVIFSSFTEGEHHFDIQLDFGSMYLKPGKSRETDVMLLGFFDDARLALETYADRIAEVYNIQLPPKPNVYCTWYHRDTTKSGASTETFLAENAAFARKELQSFGLNVMQIDDHWQALENDPGKRNKGPIKTFVSSSSETYPSGMAQAAETLQADGFVPGIWYMPFAGDASNPTFDTEIFVKERATGEPLEDPRWSGACIDATSAQGEAFLRERMRRIHDWGYRYIKVDGLHTGTPSLNLYPNRSYEQEPFAEAEIQDKSLTFVEAYRKGLSLLREENPDTFILGCAATQNMVSFAPVFGMVDGMRVGPDNDAARRGDWRKTTLGADYAGNLWFLNNRVWYNDPDPFYVRSSNPLNKARWMATWLAVSGAMNTTSMQYADLDPERLDLIKRTLPSHSLPARPVDILENEHPQIWEVHNDRMHVLGLFNWEEETEAVIHYPLDRLGLDPEKKYHAFDFWDNRHLGQVTGHVSTTLPGASCQTLALREVSDYPQLISTSRHITQGLIDVLNENWNAKDKTLTGTSEVVAGDPYEMRIICPPGFELESISVWEAMCEVDSIEQSDDGLARVRLMPKNTGPLDWSVRYD